MADGSHSITAIYSGATGFTGPLQGDSPTAVNKATTTTSLATLGRSVGHRPAGDLHRHRRGHRPRGGHPDRHGRLHQRRGTCAPPRRSPAPPPPRPAPSPPTARPMRSPPPTAVTPTSSPRGPACQTVNTAATTTTVTTKVNPSATGESVTFTATSGWDAPGRAPRPARSTSPAAAPRSPVGAGPAVNGTAATCDTTFIAGAHSSPRSSPPPAPTSPPPRLRPSPRPSTGRTGTSITFTGGTNSTVTAPGDLHRHVSATSPASEPRPGRSTVQERRHRTWCVPGADGRTLDGQRRHLHVPPPMPWRSGPTRSRPPTRGTAASSPRPPPPTPRT